MPNTSLFQLVRGLFYEFSSVNKDEDLAFFLTGKAADLTKHDCLAGTSWHDEQSPVGLHHSDADTGDRLLLIGT